MMEVENKHLETSTLPVNECIILAGGLGTRLKEAVPGLPKCLAPVAGKPFLSYIIDYLRMQGIERFVFSLGYLFGEVENYLQSSYPTLDHYVVIEDSPLGTGGALLPALQKVKTENVLIVNGDTLFKINLLSLSEIHFKNNAECTLALKPMQDFERYGVVEMDDNGKIISFREKQFYAEGLINGGCYLLNKTSFVNRKLSEKFSFEKDYLERFAAEGKFYGDEQKGYFIDIGIPEDFNKSQQDFIRLSLDLSKIDKNWTLFLDRDGVINEEKVGHYILHWEEFIFSSGVLEVFRKLYEKFGRIIVVSNQRGVGKGLMSEADLQSIHLEMQREVEIVGAKIEKIYYSIKNDDRDFQRKPNPGMAFRAMQDYPDIDPSRTIMVGNKPSDMKFGRAAGFYTVFVRTTNPEQPFPHADIDAVFPSLPDFAASL
jgi:D-glycero-alpha-D-manno-heptose 1-phosphate guanylyltransferase